MKDKVVVITGGSSGIGKALAREFGKRGSKIFITGRNDKDLHAAIEELAIEKIVISGCPADVSKPEDNERMASEAIKQFGTIDILINNAGISMRAGFDEVDMDVVKKVMDINFYGALFATRACLEPIKKNRGSIIGISSIAGYRGLPKRTGYCASKFALNGFLEVLRTELHSAGVHVMTACPGFTATDIRKRALTKHGQTQNASPREEEKMMSAERCAELIYQATLKRRNILILTTLGKLTVIINKLFPSLADKLVIREMAKEK